MFKTIKSKLIFVIIFCIICIVTTALVIMYKKIDIDENNQQQENLMKTESQKDVEGINLKGKYDENDIKIIEKNVSKDKIEINYIQIDGLKDLNIQSSINKQIEDIALNKYKEKINLNNVVNATVSVMCFANYGNTISVYINYWGKVDDNSDDIIDDRIGINFDLNTGAEIKLSQVFTSDAPVEEILRKSAYRSFVANRAEMNLSGQLVVEKYGNIEEDISDIIELYRRGKLENFYYTEKTVDILYEDTTISISMEEWNEYIAIYNRFLKGESIYSSNDIGLDNLYVLTTKDNKQLYYYNYQNEKNYYIEIAVDWWGEESSDEIEKKIVLDKVKSIEKEISKIKVVANENKNNFYILNYSIYFDRYQDEETEQKLIRCHEDGNYYEMTVHDFEENVESFIISCSRKNYDSGNTYIYDFTDILKISPQKSDEYYNIETGEKIVI